MARASVGLLLLLLLGGVAQAGLVEDEARAVDPSYAPVQLVIDRSLEVVGLAFTESFDDGSADDAQALVHRIEAYVRALTAVAGYGERSVAQEVQAYAAYPFANDIVAAIAPLPGHASLLEQSYAFCMESAERATLADAKQWHKQAVEAERAARVAATQLHALNDTAPAGVRAGALAVSARTVEAWIEARVVPTLECTWALLYELSLEGGVLDNATFGAVIGSGSGAGGLEFSSNQQAILNALAGTRTPVLWVSPSEAWPTQVVQFRGFATRGGTVQSSGLSLAQEIQPGPFSFTHTIPADVTMGEHAITLDGQAVTLTVVRAPTGLRLEPVPDVGLRAILTSPATPLLAGDLPLTWGNREGPQLRDGIAILRTLETGTFMVQFPGTDRLEPSTAQFTLNPATQLEFEGGTPPAGQAPPTLPWWLWLCIAAILVGAAVAAWRGARQKETAVASGDAPAQPTLGPQIWVPKSRVGPTRFEIGLVAAVAGFHLRLVRAGVLRPRDTARDLAAIAKQWGWNLQPAVQHFEASRYGRQPDAKAPKLYERMRSWFQEDRP